MKGPRAEPKGKGLIWDLLCISPKVQFSKKANLGFDFLYGKLCTRQPNSYRLELSLSSKFSFWLSPRLKNRKKHSIIEPRPRFKLENFSQCVKSKNYFLNKECQISEIPRKRMEEEEEKKKFSKTEETEKEKYFYFFPRPRRCSKDLAAAAAAAVVSYL